MRIDCNLFFGPVFALLLLTAEFLSLYGLLAVLAIEHFFNLISQHTAGEKSVHGLASVFLALNFNPGGNMLQPHTA